MGDDAMNDVAMGDVAMGDVAMGDVAMGVVAMGVVAFVCLQIQVKTHIDVSQKPTATSFLHQWWR